MKKESFASYANRVRSQYPNHPSVCPVESQSIRQRSGCKVHWLIFATEELAKQCSDWAIVEARIRREQGYDSGYCIPGGIEKVHDGYEVCIL